MVALTYEVHKYSTNFSTDYLRTERNLVDLQRRGYRLTAWFGDEFLFDKWELSDMKDLSVVAWQVFSVTTLILQVGGLYSFPVLTEDYLYFRAGDAVEILNPLQYCPPLQGVYLGATVGKIKNLTSMTVPPIVGQDRFIGRPEDLLNYLQQTYKVNELSLDSMALLLHVKIEDRGE